MEPALGDDEQAPPPRLGNLELVRLLGRGGMASVYLALGRGPCGFSRQVAVKLAPRAGRDAESDAMFVEEASLAARVHHGNVVGVLELALEPRPYMVLEYVEGDSLLGLLRARRLPVPVVTAIVLDVLAGLHAAHELRDDRTGAPLGLVHRDVSPQNILIGLDGAARITDFGVVYAADRRVVTRVGQLKGKPGYWAPEQAQGAVTTRRADLFSVGVVLWEALAGRRLFPGKHVGAQLERLLSATPAPPSSFRPELSPALDEVVLRALARDEVLRWPTAESFADALRVAAGPPASRADVGRLVAEVAGPVLAQRREEVRLARLRLNADDAAATTDFPRQVVEPELPVTGDTSTVNAPATASQVDVVPGPAPSASVSMAELRPTTPFEAVEAPTVTPTAEVAPAEPPGPAGLLRGWSRPTLVGLALAAIALGTIASGLVPAWSAGPSVARPSPAPPPPPPRAPVVAPAPVVTRLPDPPPPPPVADEPLAREPAVVPPRAARDGHGARARAARASGPEHFPDRI